MDEDEMLKLIQNNQDMFRVISDNLQLQITILRQKIEAIHKKLECEEKCQKKN